VRTVALVPLRTPGTGKSRLAPALSEAERAGLAAAMLADVVAALRDAGVGRIVVAAGGPEAAAVAGDLGLASVQDPPMARSLDYVLAVATARLGRIRQLLVVTADLQLLTAGDVRTMLTTAGDVIVARTPDDGSAALLRRPGHVMTTAFGPGSAAVHEARARAAGLRTKVLDLPGFRDVDTLDDLRQVADASPGPATAAFIDQLGARLHVTN